MIDHAIHSLRLEIEALRVRLNSIDPCWLGSDRGWPVPCVHWKDNRYLTLIYSKNGRRWVEYIGSDPEQVSFVLASIRKQQQYQALSERLHAAELELSGIENEVYFLGLRCRQLITGLIEGD